MKNCPQGTFVYTIKSGDTFFFLAQRFNTSVDAIMRVNPGVNPNRLQIGQSICIPSASPPMPPHHDRFPYVIQMGDTLYQLSLKYNVGVDAIIRANPGVDPNNLQIGQIIYIPTA